VTGLGLEDLFSLDRREGNQKELSEILKKMWVCVSDDNPWVDDFNIRGTRQKKDEGPVAKKNF